MAIRPLLGASNGKAPGSAGGYLLAQCETYNPLPLKRKLTY